MEYRFNLGDVGVLVIDLHLDILCHEVDGRLSRVVIEHSGDTLERETLCLFQVFFLEKTMD